MREYATFECKDCGRQIRCSNIMNMPRNLSRHRNKYHPDKRGKIYYMRIFQKRKGTF